MKINRYLSSAFLLFLVIFIASGCDAKKSADPVSNGQNGNPANNNGYWQVLSAPDVVLCAAVDNANNIYIGTSVGMYERPVSQATWNKVTTSGFTSTSSVSIIRPDASGKIYAMVGSDIFLLNGTSSAWTNVSKNINSPAITYSKTNTFNLDKAGNIYAGMYVSVKPDPQSIGVDQNILAKSTDGGQTWTELRITQFQGQINDIATDSNGAIMVIMDATVYRSIDGGNTWNQAVSGIGTANPLLLKVNSKNIVYAGTGHGILQSADEGITWDPANYTTYCPTLAINSKDYLFAGAINSAFVSTDNAASWTEISSGLKHSIDGFSNCRLQAFDNDGFIYAILEGVLYKSSVSTTK